MGWCNCKNDQWQLNRKTPYLNIVRDTYHTVRVDVDGLCFLCANTALVAPPPEKEDPRRTEYNRQFQGETTVSLENPDGIFGEK